MNKQEIKDLETGSKIEFDFFHGHSESGEWTESIYMEEGKFWEDFS